MKPPQKNKDVEKTAAKEPKREQESKKESPRPAAGSRGETRVGYQFSACGTPNLFDCHLGENEPHASPNC